MSAVSFRCSGREKAEKGAQNDKISWQMAKWNTKIDEGTIPYSAYWVYEVAQPWSLTLALEMVH